MCVVPNILLLCWFQKPNFSVYRLQRSGSLTIQNFIMSRIHSTCTILCNTCQNVKYNISTIFFDFHEYYYDISNFIYATPTLILLCVAGDLPALNCSGFKTQNWRWNSFVLTQRRILWENVELVERNVLMKKVRGPIVGSGRLQRRLQRRRCAFL